MDGREMDAAAEAAVALMLIRDKASRGLAGNGMRELRDISDVAQAGLKALAPHVTAQAMEAAWAAGEEP